MKSRSHTKSGPGRFHGNGAMTIIGDDVAGKTHYWVKKPTRKHPIARKGGNWKGTEYLTQPEWDRGVRAGIAASSHIKHKDMRRIVNARARTAELAHIIDERRAA